MAKTSVGENSFYGKLDKVLGRKNVDNFQMQMMNGTTALIIDAFDEAEIRRGRSDIKLFLDDVIDFVDGYNNLNFCRLGMVDRLDRLRHNTIICSNDQDCDIC